MGRIGVGGFGGLKDCASGCRGFDGVYGGISGEDDKLHSLEGGRARWEIGGAHDVNICVGGVIKKCFYEKGLHGEKSRNDFQKLWVFLVMEQPSEPVVYISGRPQHVWSIRDRTPSVHGNLK